MQGPTENRQGEWAPWLNIIIIIIIIIIIKDEPSDRRGAVYKIKCCDCQATYIGETGRNLSVQLTEHKQATRNGDINNHIAEHHLKTNPRMGLC